MRRFRFAAACGVVLLMSWPGAGILHSDLPLYTIEDLGTLDGAPLTPRAINNSGHVVGLADGAEGLRLAFFIDALPARDLGSLGGAYGVANGINDRDEIVGFSRTPEGVFRAFLHTVATGMTEIGALDGGASFAYGINASGQIVGYSGADSYRAFRYSAGTGMTDLGTLNGSGSFGYGINDAGHVTGCSWTPDSTLHAVLWNDTDPMLDLGTLGGTQSCGMSINAAGQVAGWSWIAQDSNQHAFRSSPPAGLQDLGTLGGGDSGANGINDDGTVVGWSTGATGDRRAFVFTDTEGMVDLNDRIDPALGWTLTDAAGINAGGQIVGIGMLDGASHAFRLTPPPAAEEPADVAPPTIGWLRIRPSVLWPAMRQMVPVRVAVGVRDDTDPAPACKVTAVTSSEPDAGTSRQDRPHDIVLRGDLSLRLRAELGPRSSARVYTVLVTCTDAAGNEASRAGTVRVPRTLRPREIGREDRRHPAVDVLRVVPIHHVPELRVVPPAAR